MVLLKGDDHTGMRRTLSERNYFRTAVPNSAPFSSLWL